MKTKMKAIITTFMAFAVAVVLFNPIAAKADLNPFGDPITVGENVKATISNEGVVTLTGTGATYDYTGQQYMENKTPFVEYSIRGKKNGQIKKIVVGDGITHIGSLLFYFVDCENIVFGKDVKTIGANAFCGNTRVNSLVMSPATVEVGEKAFEGCSSLVKLDLKNVKKLGERAFYGNKLSEVVIPYECSAPDSSLAKSGDSKDDPINPYKYPTLKWQTWIGLNANGGTVVMNGQNAYGLLRIYGEKYKYIPTPTKSGSKFVGWYSQKTSKLVTKNSTVEWKDTLIAKWCDHSETEVRGRKEATYTYKGYTGDVYCKKCGMLLREGDVIPKKVLKRPIVSSISKIARGLTFKAKAIDANGTGVIVQYSTDKNFDNASSKKITGTKSKKVKITGLRSYTTYYVRMRTYKNCKKNKVVYSKWSKVKSVKTR